MIKLKNISYTYEDGTTALTAIDWEYGKGTVGIAGANGVGKSTLLSLLCGILLPSEGEITIDELTVTKRNLPRIRARVGMVFQNPDDQLFMPRVKEDVGFAMRQAGASPEETEARVKSVLTELGIAHLAEKAPYRLSGGEKRSAAIATALITEPSVLLLDEPTAFLDARGRQAFEAYLPKLAPTKLIASHDIDFLYGCCDHVLLLKDGRLHAFGKTGEILEDEALLVSAGLELPIGIRKCRQCPYTKGEQK